MKRIIAYILALLIVSGCSSNEIRSMNSLNDLVTSPGYFSKLKLHLLRELDLDPDVAISLKDFSFVATNSGKLQSAWIEFRATTNKDGVSQFIVRLTDGHWSSERVKVYGGKHEFTEGAPLIRHLDSIDWSSMARDLGPDSHLSTRLDSSQKCQVKIFVMNPNTATNQQNSEPTKISACTD